MCGNLSGSEIDELAKKLASVFDLHGIEVATHVSTGDRLFVEYVGTGLPLRKTIFDLLNALEARGLTARFLGHAYAERHHRQDLRDLIVRLYPEAMTLPTSSGTELVAQRHGALQDNAPKIASAPGFQRNLRPHIPQVEARVWLERLAANERRVCRVEIDGHPAGTGFLVGSDTVLTNWHVVMDASASARLGTIKCRFDYIRLADAGIQQGVIVDLAADGLIDMSPYAPGEARNIHDPPPTQDQLDYALLRLAVAAASHQVHGGTRGWITLLAPPPAFAPHMPILILQHPLGAPLKLALDTDAVISANANGTRVRYATNTEEGSSGAPCFTMDWQLVALHHYGDPAWGTPTFNQGVPIGKIRDQIVGRGFGAMLGN